MNNIEENMQAQFDTASLLAETSAEGYIIDESLLKTQIDIFTKKVDQQEVELQDTIIEVFGW